MATVRQTDQEQRRPTPAQERALAEVLGRCRTRYHVARQQRITAWQRGPVSVSREPAASRTASHRRGEASVRSPPLAPPPGRAGAARQDRSGVLPPGTARRAGGLPALQRPGPLPPLHLQGIGQRRPAGHRCPGARENRAQQRPLVPSQRGHAQDGHDHARGRWLVRLPLLCGRPVPPPAAQRASDGDRAWPGVLGPPGGWQPDREPTHLARGRAELEAGAATGFPRRKKGSQRRRKAVVRRAKAHQHTRNQRRDFPHQEAGKRLRAYDVIYHDELRVRTRVPNHSRAKSLADAGWSAFLAIRTFTAASAGKRVHAVTPAYTSQACSGCGVLVSKGLSVRWHECPDGGTSLHRDHNAALNILRLGQTQENNVGRDTAFRR